MCDIFAQVNPGNDLFLISMLGVFFDININPGLELDFIWHFCRNPCGHSPPGGEARPAQFPCLIVCLRVIHDRSHIRIVIKEVQGFICCIGLSLYKLCKFFDSVFRCCTLAPAGFVNCPNRRQPGPVTSRTSLKVL
jgi:hypothetical protein